MNQTVASGLDATVDPKEVEHYRRLADLWWDQSGPFWPLHRLNALRVEYLNNDDITDDNRSRVIIHDSTRFSRNLTTSIDYDRVSDKDYLQDLGDSLSLASVTHLKRTGQVQYTTSWWQLGVQLDDYQTVDKTIAQRDRPYQRLPRVTFKLTSPFRPGGIETGLNSEMVRFDADEQVTGDRIDLWPDLSLPIQRSAFDLTPRVGVRYTAYQLDDQEPSD